MKIFNKNFFIHSFFMKSFMTLFIFISLSQNLYAACGGTVRTWAGTTNAWDSTGNWSGGNIPDTASEDVVIINTGSNAKMLVNNTVVACIDVQSGVFEGTQNRLITLKGDYFRAPYSNTLNLTNNRFRIEMGGTTAQTFEAVDDIRDLILSNPSSVTLKNTFRIRSDFTITSTGITYIEGHVTFNRTGGGQTIPAGHTLIIKNGATLVARGGLTIDGTLKVEGGGTLVVRNTEILSVSATGTLQLLGASGNPAKLTSDGANKYYTFDVAGTLSANQFQITRPNILGINITGTLSQMDHGELRSPNDSGVLMTIGAAATMPTTFDTIGFFNDDASTLPKNIDATSYTGSVITISAYSGGIADTAYEIDPSSKITWSAPSPTELSLVNDAEAGDVQTFMDPADEFTFGEYSFSLTQPDTATNITEVIVTMTGTGTMSDLEYVRAYRDSNFGCNWGVSDTQIGSNLTFSGYPPKATITITSGDIQTSGPSSPGKCLHIRAKASANPTDQKTIEFAISGTAEVVNDQAYSFSVVSGPPVGTEASIIRNPNFSSWNGSVSTSWNTATNWTGGIPGTTRNCTIGAGTNIALLDVNPGTCASTTLQSNGEIDWNSTANTFEIYGGLDLQSSFTFTTATSGTIEMKGSANQSLSMATAFPGNFVINNSGGASNNIINIDGDSTINGNLTCTQGKVEIGSTKKLTVLGNITIASGCEISISAGGTLELGSGSTITVSAGGTLSAIGNASTSAKITTTSTSNAMNIIVNGTIKAQYYIFEHLGAAGVSIESGATIDASNYLQNGSFLYPVDDNTTMLYLKKQIPGNSWASITFDDGGSAALNPKNINTTGAAAGTLTIVSFSGNLTEDTYEVAPTYLLSWNGATNTIALTREAVSDASVTVGSTYNMGRFGFTQSSAHASFVDTDITSLEITLTGTGTASDISSVKIYTDTDCDGLSGTLVGTGTFSGVPASKTFTLTAGQFTVDASATSPPKRCIYVEYDIASGATNGNTLGVQILSGTDFVDSEGYGIASGTPAPVTLGTASTINAPTTTIWTGATSTAWTDVTNWSAGLPSSAKSCEIPTTANNPIISTGSVDCDDVNITTGSLTVNVSSTLNFYGDFSNTGSFTLNGNLEVEDGGGFSNHSISSSTTLANLYINKTGTGNVYINDTSLTINSLSNNSSTSVLHVQGGKKLILPNGLNLTTGQFKLWGNSSVEIASGQSLTIAGGYLNIVGTNDTFPQSQTSKAYIGPQGGTGTWTFSATSGTVYLKGFHFDKLDNSGMNIGGSTAVTYLGGGQLTNLSASYASMKAIQLNNSGGIPITATNIGWSWGAFNSFDPVNANTPVEADGYTILSSTGCSSGTIDFTGWTGDWYETDATFDPSSKISATGCTINLGASSSSIALSSFTIAGYNNAIDLKWETSLESNHRGFNVYRANSLGSDFEQINPVILKNFNNAGQAKGKYRFTDNDVSNDTQYYYYIEDVELTGARILHGPKTATPYASLGAPPADEADENSGSNDNDGDDGGTSSGGVIANPSYRDLGNGVVIHSQTSSAIRLEINPAAPQFSASNWDGTYEDVSILGYAKMTLPNNPELLERILLIEVYDFATTAALIGTASITETILASHKISPAPSYTQNGNGELVAAYSPDISVYTTNQNTFNEFYNIESNLIKTSGKTYLKVKINPLKLNPVSEDITHATKIVLDIGLDGGNWTPTPPSSGEIINPFNIANTLRIDYEKAGFYELKYNDLLDSEVLGPFDGADTTAFRLYFKGEEYALQISSANGNFEAGDLIRFYLPFEKTLEDKKNTAILSTIEIDDESTTIKRIQNVDASTTGFYLASEEYSIFTKTFEENLEFVSGEPLGDNLDHYFWKGLANYAGGDELSMTINLPELNPTSDYNVKLKFYVKGQIGFYGNHADHHVSVFVDGVEESDITFEVDERQILVFEIPADRFIAGNNNIILKVNGTYAPAGDYDRVFVNKLIAEYVGNTDGGSGYSKIALEETLVVHSVGNFTTNNISIFDITNVQNTKSLTGFDKTGSGPYIASFVIDDETNDNDEKLIYLVEDGSYLSPIGLSLNPGYPNSLKNTNNSAKLLLIGHKSLLQAASEFIEHKIANGISIKTASLEQIYGEFSDGQKSAKAIKDFVNFSLDHWTTSPKYVFILGDGTLDPLNHNIDSNAANNISQTNSATIPMPFLTGRFIDFGADNYFASNSTSPLPRVALGRLPTNDPAKVIIYGKKVIAYENGNKAPLSANEKKIVFIADKDKYIYDKFDLRSNNLRALTTQFETSLISRTILGDNASTLTAINNTFDNSPYLMSFMGHGANDRFGNGIFRTNEAQILSNANYPIAITWNCEAAYYYDASNNLLSLAEELVLQEDGGAIVFMGSTTQTTPTAQERLAQNFFTILNNEISSHYTGETIGDIFYQSKLALGDGAYTLDILNSQSLIGDPSLKIPSSMFAPAPVAKRVIKAPAKSGGGCSLSASTGANSIPWYFGLLEWFIYLLLPLFFRRATRNKNY